MDKSRSFWEQNDRCGKQTISHDSSFPVRSSSSAHDILSDVCSPPKQLRDSRPSAAGVWRTPPSQHPAPSTQPKRIDIPVTRAGRIQTNPQTTSMNRNFQGDRTVVAPPNPDHHIHVCPIPESKKPPQSSFPSQQRRTSPREEGLTPSKQVSFQQPPAQQRHWPKHRNEPEQGTDVWWRRRRRRREAQAELEKPKELCEVELLEQEVQRLRVQEELTLEKNVRLRRLSLEWHFQKRLQEIQKKGDGEEEEDEDLDTLLMRQQLERQIQARVTAHTAHILQNPSFRRSEIVFNPSDGEKLCCKCQH